MRTEVSVQSKRTYTHEYNSMYLYGMKRRRFSFSVNILDLVFARFYIIEFDYCAYISEENFIFYLEYEIIFIVCQLQKFKGKW